jgi:hypothetical protein
MFKQLITSLAVATSVAVPLGAGAGDKANSDPAAIANASCTTLTQEIFISNAGVQTIVPIPCFKHALTESVSGQSNPWDQTKNPTLIYSASGDAFPPVVVGLAARKIIGGDYISITCTGGTTNAGGLPDSGCAGLTSVGPTNNTFQPACGTFYPTAFIDPSNYPINLFQVIGVFATTSGVVVGKPFPVSPQAEVVAVPQGAKVLQLGMNDCLNSDNSPAALTVQVKF